MSTGSVSGPWPTQRPSKRSKLRNGTFIIPSTGERARRSFSLRTPSSHTSDGGPNDIDEYLPVFDPDISIGEKFYATTHNCRLALVTLWQWLNSSSGRGLLKCTIAYVLGSLFTFWPPLTRILGSRDGKHIVATITVYFHPARTVGSMLEAVMISTVAVMYAEIICVLSMAVSVVIGAKLHVMWLSYTLVLIIFVGGGLGLVGWVKQRLNQPLVNVACTLASIAIISVVTKENVVQHGIFSNEKIIQVLQMLVFGISITAGVNVLLWRVSARHRLRDGMANASTTLGDMLSMITRGFLRGSEEELQGEGFEKRSANWNKVYADLNKTIREAKFEHYLLGREKVYHLDKAVFKCLESLAQSIGGLRSAAYTQFTLMKETAEPQPAGTLSPRSNVFSPALGGLVPCLQKRNSSTGALSVIDESPHEAEEATPRTLDAVPTDAVATRTFRNPSDIFELFIALLGPSMKSLAYTLSEILREPPFGGTPDYNHITLNDNFRQSLTDAANLYHDTRGTALHELYKNIELEQSRSEKIQADFEEVAAACGHFSFSLQALGEEMHRYLSALDDLKVGTQDGRSWSWLKFWRQFPRLQTSAPALDEGDREREPLIRPIRKNAVPKGIPDRMIHRRDSFAWDAAPQSSKVVRSLSQRALKSLRILSRDDIRFGLKVGIGAALWALLAFLPQTRPMYMHWRGEWGLLSFMIVCSMTVGASNTTGYARFLGTIAGATCAVINWNISSGNAIPLVILGWVVSFAAFYVILIVGNAPMGRITLLAYNVSTLYAYSMSLKLLPEDEDDDEDDGVRPLILEIVKHRVLAVMAGILWGWIICRIVWPISARGKFKQGLSIFYLQLGLIWKRGPLAVLLRGLRPSPYLKDGEERALQRYSSKLESLWRSASAEFSLRGPFPEKSMGKVMASTGMILNAFHAMCVVEQRRLLNRPGGHHLSEGEVALLALTSQERRVLSDRICHVFQVLASSFMLEYPLTDAIPSIQGSRDRLLGKIYAVRQQVNAVEQKRRDIATSPLAGGGSTGSVASVPLDGPTSTTAIGDAMGNGNGNDKSNGNAGVLDGSNGKAARPLLPPGTVIEERDYALLYAYVLVANQVALELEEVVKEIERLYGVLNETDMLLQ